MRTWNLIRAAAFLAVAGAILTSCGGNPSSPSDAGVMLKGTLVGDGTASVLSTGGAAAREITITVKENPSLTTTVSGNGTFTLTGLPAGSFTLVFTSNGRTLGTITISDVQPGQQITIIVRITGNNVRLEDEDREDGDDDGDDGPSTKACMINGGRVGDSIELEGNVASGNSVSFMMNVQGNRARGPVQVDASGASFKCNGPKVTDQQCRDSVRSGAKVHVKGTLTSCDTSAALARAREVMVQK